MYNKCFHLGTVMLDLMGIQVLQSKQRVSSESFRKQNMYQTYSQFKAIYKRKCHVKLSAITLKDNNSIVIPFNINDNGNNASWEKCTTLVSKVCFKRILICHLL